METRTSPRQPPTELISARKLLESVEYSAQALALLRRMGFATDTNSRFDAELLRSVLEKAGRGDMVRYFDGDEFLVSDKFGRTIGGRVVSGDDHILFQVQKRVKSLEELRALRGATEKLMRAGYDSLKKVAESSAEELCKDAGIELTAAERAITAARGELQASQGKPHTDILNIPVLKVIVTVSDRLVTIEREGRKKKIPKKDFDSGENLTELEGRVRMLVSDFFDRREELEEPLLKSAEFHPS